MNTMNMVWTDYKDSALQAEAAGNFELAGKCWHQVVNLLRHEPNSQQSLSSALERLAAVYSHSNQVSNAIPPLTESLDIKTRHLGDHHPLAAQVENDLARLYYISGKLPEAIHYAQRCLKSYEVIHGEESEQAATMCTNIAAAFQLSSLRPQAEPYYKRALKIRTKLFGESHAQTRKVLKDYAKLLREMHRDAEADHLDSFAKGEITGSWKAVQIPDENALSPASNQDCNFCGQKIGTAKKCSRCGTPAGAQI